MKFTKMQGLGNDFVLFDGPVALGATDVQAICNRRFGVGADGVLAVIPGDPIRMDYWNADGSAAEMCGNGLRCVARYARDKELVASERFLVETPNGAKRVMIHPDRIEVEIFDPVVIGHRTIGGVKYHVIDVGNPHAVSIVDDPEIERVDEVGPMVSADPSFEKGVNVEFASITPDGIRMRVWERGVGETLACGTGMVAAAFVGSKTHGLTGVIPVAVRGGNATVELRDGTAWLSGPAEYSFVGEL